MDKTNGTNGTNGHGESMTSRKRLRPSERKESAGSIEDFKHLHQYGTVPSLALAGGNEGLEDREWMQNMLVETIEKMQAELPSPCKVHPRDAIWASPEYAFVGCGLHTNYPGIRYALTHDLFKTHRLAVVRDIFDRSDSVPFLDSYFRVVSDDVTVVLPVAFEHINRRLVNEYVKRPTGEYVLVRHDINFITYLHENGYRVVPVPNLESLLSYQPSQIPIQQSTNHVLMVAPTAFRSTIEAARASGLLESHSDLKELSDAELQSRVLREFADLHTLITQKAGVQLHLFTHEDYHDTPDACFPNNWFSTHTNLEIGECTLVLYPLRNPNRRRERRPEFVSRLKRLLRYIHTFDISKQENDAEPAFLEGTGSLVLDRVHHIAYVALSERSTESVAQTWADVLNYSLMTFDAQHSDGRSVRHTDEVLCIGTSVAIFCAEAITDPIKRSAVLESLKKTHEVVEISLEQMESYCGAVLELETWSGEPCLVMSNTAYEAFTAAQKEVLMRHSLGGLLHTDLKAIEVLGEGSARSLIGELF